MIDKILDYMIMERDRFIALGLSREESVKMAIYLYFENQNDSRMDRIAFMMEQITRRIDDISRIINSLEEKIK